MFVPDGEQHTPTNRWRRSSSSPMSPRRSHTDGASSMAVPLRSTRDSTTSSPSIHRLGLQHMRSSSHLPVTAQSVSTLHHKHSPVTVSGSPNNTGWGVSTPRFTSSSSPTKRQRQQRKAPVDTEAIRTTFFAAVVSLIGAMPTHHRTKGSRNENGFESDSDGDIHMEEVIELFLRGVGGSAPSRKDSEEYQFLESIVRTQLVQSWLYTRRRLQREPKHPKRAKVVAASSSTSTSSSSTSSSMEQLIMSAPSLDEIWNTVRQQTLDEIKEPWQVRAWKETYQYFVFFVMSLFYLNCMWSLDTHF